MPLLHFIVNKKWLTNHLISVFVLMTLFNRNKTTT